MIESSEVIENLPYVERMEDLDDDFLEHGDEIVFYCPENGCHYILSYKEQTVWKIDSDGEERYSRPFESFVN